MLLKNYNKSFLKCNYREHQSSCVSVNLQFLSQRQVGSWSKVFNTSLMPVHLDRWDDGVSAFQVWGSKVQIIDDGLFWALDAAAVNALEILEPSLSLLLFFCLTTQPGGRVASSLCNGATTSSWNCKTSSSFNSLSCFIAHWLQNIMHTWRLQLFCFARGIKKKVRAADSLFSISDFQRLWET